MESFRDARRVDRKSRKSMWQRAIEIRKSTTGDGRHVMNSKRNWENKHSTVLKRGKGRQEAVAGGDSPSSIPDLQVWEMTVWMWAGNVKWNNPIWGTSWVLGKQRKQLEGENWLSPTQVLLLGVTAWYQIGLWEGRVHPCSNYTSIWDPFQQRIATLGSLLKDGAYRN